MTGRMSRWVLRGYLLLVFVFVFSPVVMSMIFSFNSDRFPTIPLGGFTTHWYLSLIHISEPTRPLYISYAVFCLKKKHQGTT